MRAVGFPPLAAAQCTRLILGSMPGKVSLNAQEYYAHPRNLFWDFVEQWLGIERALPYATRCERLVGRGVAVWDVLERCQRVSSLDADIVRESMQPNDFTGFLVAHPLIRTLYFNGATAELVFRRSVLPSLPSGRALALFRLPSTSPANAGISREAKALAWRVIAD